MLPSQGFGDFDRRQHRSPSPMASSNLVSNIHGGGYGGWNGLHQEVLSATGFSYMAAVVCKKLSKMEFRCLSVEELAIFTLLSHFTSDSCCH